MIEPVIRVGIMLADKIQVEEDYAKGTFTVKDVPIGIGFHWGRTEDQEFMGTYQIVTEGEKKRLINNITLEDYLVSVISSEMAATCAPELLKAHAVISRSWLMAQIEKSGIVRDSNYSSVVETRDEYIRWYDREDHSNFDVCADDHCQRYQGVRKIPSPRFEKIIRETYGEFLIHNGKICDARFSKCCGGRTELFENTWESARHPYLTSVEDKPKEGERDFCNTSNPAILRQILNDYDQPTSDFYKWEVSYTPDQLSSILRRKTGWDFGEIRELIPRDRGVSGRIIRLEIVGSKMKKTIGKELFIRKALSRTHLYSSNFTVIPPGQESDSFILRGRGWGHGVGLCQIGAAVMASKGYSYRDILKHYFPLANLKRLYEPDNK